jgi:hypothetical protein
MVERITGRGDLADHADPQGLVRAEPAAQREQATGISAPRSPRRRRG